MCSWEFSGLDKIHAAVLLLLQSWCISSGLKHVQAFPAMAEFEESAPHESLLQRPHCVLRLPPVSAVGCFGMQPWVESTTNATGHALGADADVPWLKVTPVALRGVLNWLTQRYGPVELKV